MIRFPRASQVALMVKNLLANAGNIRSLGWEDPLEEGMATHSRILVWRIPCTEEAWRAMVHRVIKSQTRLKRLSTQVHVIRLCLSALPVTLAGSDVTWMLPTGSYPAPQLCHRLAQGPRVAGGSLEPQGQVVLCLRLWSGQTHS